MLSLEGASTGSIKDMPDYLILVTIGGSFTLLGLIAIVCGRSEQRGFYDSLSTRIDAREFLQHEPEHPEMGALKIGGWILITIGLVLLAMGGGFWLWG